MLTEDRFNAISGALASDVPIQSIVIMTGVSEETIIEVAHSGGSYDYYKKHRRNSTKHQKKNRSAKYETNNAILNDIRAILTDILEVMKGDQNNV